MNAKRKSTAPEWKVEYRYFGRWVAGSTYPTEAAAKDAAELACRSRPYDGYRLTRTRRKAP